VQLLAFLEMTANPAACAAVVDAQTGAVVGSAAPSLRAAVEWTCNASLMEKSGLASAMAVSQQQQSEGSGDRGALQRLSFSLPTVDIKGQQQPQTQQDSEATLLVIDQLVAFLRESPAARALRLLHFGWLSVHSNVPPPSLSSPPLSAALASPSLSSSFSAGSAAVSAPFRLGASASSASLGMSASSSAASLHEQARAGQRCANQRQE
jgi:hypothetical protein